LWRALLTTDLRITEEVPDVKIKSIQYNHFGQKPFALLGLSIFGMRVM
jgi:hypothetical protein